MSCFAGPYNRGIVTSGLVLYYDVNEPVCYSSGRTDIQDLSRNGNAGTLVNGVGYSANNGGSLVFDGVNDSINAGTSTSLSFTNKSFVLEATFKITNYQPGAYFGLTNVILARGPASTYNYELQVTNSTTISFCKRTSPEKFYDIIMQQFQLYPIISFVFRLRMIILQIHYHFIITDRF